MKRFGVLVLAALLCCYTCGIAEQAEDDTNLVIKFRDIEWWATFDDVDDVLAGSSNAKRPSRSRENDDIDSINYAEDGYFSDDRVDEGGVSATYYDIDVAGYTTDVETYYMYPIEMGYVQRVQDNAQMYFAMYEFEDMQDLPAVYDDLQTKLTNLYGEGAYKSNGYYDSTYWEDAQGNAVWLLIDKDVDYRSVRLAYAAAGHRERLAELDAQIAAETLAVEEQQRNDNADNSSGL